jgi:putative redox protein
MSKFNFTNRNGLELTGKIEFPSGDPWAFAIFAHCFTCSKNVKAATQVSRRLSERGIAVLRFDFTGLGNSEGDFANSDFSSNVNDLIDAAAALSEQHSAPALLIGHSLGGAAALMASAELESVHAVATIGAPCEPAHVQRLIERTSTAQHPDGSITIELGGRELAIGSQFVSDLKRNRVADVLPTLKKPLMIFHSPIDSIVSVDNARRIYETAKHPKSFVSIDGADHMLSNPDDANFVADTLAAWAARYLKTGETSNSESRLSVAAGTVVVSETSGLTQSIMTHQHEFNADEPSSLGGNGRGPAPYELLMASLGACTSMTLRMYARRKGWSLDSIKVTLKHTRIDADDCTTCETADGKIDRFEKEIVVAGDLSADQVARLGEIADRCPVHRTLTHEKLIETNITRVSD